MMLDNTAPAVGPIVAIGASAGGLEAMSRLFALIPGKTGMAFIVIQHLDPVHKSLLAELLAKHTAMPVTEAVEGSALRADHVYVIPPGRYLTVRAGLLHLSIPEAHPGVRDPFDHLLRSLAKACGPRTIAVVLSGTGADGSTALRALHAAGGMIIAQSPADAEFSGMPQSALATGLVDRTVALADIPAVLQDMLAAMPARHEQAAASATADYTAILDEVRSATGHDFRGYKPGTIGRRIERRMGLLGLRVNQQDDYLALLQRDPVKCELLAKDLLINVTNFFRDPDMFETLTEKVVPEIIAGLEPDAVLRVWVAGCSTGEEAYSLAMVCREAITASGRDIKLQIFASDLDADAIAHARAGIYPRDIAASVPAARLERFFIDEGTGYRVTPALRGVIVFSVQDVLADPPFSRIDLISCRNLLIYFNQEAQAKAIALFHFALRPAGILVLGSAESIGKGESRFEAVPGAECCFRHVASTRPIESGQFFTFAERLLPNKSAGLPPPSTRQANLAEVCRNAVLATHAPAAVLVNRHYECLYSMGPTERYLRVPPGYASLDVLAMASPPLRTKLRLAIDRAGKAEPRVTVDSTSVGSGDAMIWFRIEVQWLGDDGEGLLLVCFVDLPAQDAPAAEPPASTARIAELEQELAAAHAEMEAAIQSRKIAEQDQKAINEEALSVNEEFQSANEELLTSKEELQSLNEELTALNSQLQETLERQRLASDDLQNVLYSTNVGTMFLDAGLKIRFFTPAISPLFAVIPGDIGRPLEDLRPIANDPDLIADARRVLAEETSIDREVQAPGSAWFLRRIFPYRAHDSRIEGVVITFSDITQAKSTTRALEAAKHEAERANHAKSRFLAAASHDLRQPLQSLTLLTGLLERAVEGPRANTLLQRFATTLHAMSDMLDALLNINQIEAGVIRPTNSVFAVDEVLDRLRGEFATLAQARNLSLHILPGTAHVFSDPRLLEQMLRNLIGNAIKYTARGKILIGARRRGDKVRIEVWDTGVGIRTDQLNAIFEEFHQVDMASHDSGAGLGLGLSIVRRLGLLLGHPVDVRSVPGRGSTFSITVPAAAPAARPAPLLRPDAPMALAARHGVILVVDDDADVLDLLKQVLQPAGHQVHGAQDAAEAIRLVTDGAVRPDILLTDYNLPNGTNGVDLLERLGALLSYSLPAIILTGDISTGTIGRISQANCVRLDKPVDPRSLIEAIARICPPAKVRPVADDRPAPVAAAAPLSSPSTAPAGARGAPAIHVVDDDATIRETVREMLEAHGLDVVDYDSAEAFLAAYHPGREGCLLLDAHMPGMSGLDLLRTLRARQDNLPVILITGGGDIALAVAAMRAGASNFLEKPADRDAILACVDQALGQSHDTKQTDSIRIEAAARVATLTPRQREVLRRVLAGEPSKNIAADLDISQRTVENHRSEIMHKMKVRSIPELVKLAIDSELR